MAGKNINAFNELCKDIMIANMADTLSAVPIVQNVVISAVVKTAVEQAKAQEKEQEQRNGILGSFTKTLCN